MLRSFGVVVVILLIAGYFWQRPDTATSEVNLETVQARRETLDKAITATGVIRPKVGAEINVGARVSGIVRSIPVKIGDLVERGDLLASIDSTEYLATISEFRADLALANAQLALANSSYRRAAALASAGILSTTELESAARDQEVAQAQVAREEARVRSANIRLGYTEIHAPIDGVIADVTTRRGETVAASFASPTFVSIIDLEQMEVQAYVDETDVGRISVGQQATFSVDTYSDARFTARVTAINPRAALQNGVVNYIVLLDFDEQDGYILRPEMTAHVRLQMEQRTNVITVPRRAIRRDGGRQWVKIFRDGAWVDQAIVAGLRTDRRVEIREGLAENDTVQINQE